VGVVASLATAAVVGGTATAAKLITGADVKDASLTGADVRNGSLAGVDIRNGSVAAADLTPAVRRQLARAGSAGPVGAPGPAGADGAPGAPGADGAAGPSGAPGDDAGSVVIGRASDVSNISIAAPRFARVDDDGLPGGSEEPRRTIVSPRALVAGDLIAVADSITSGADVGLRVTLIVDGAPTALTCSFEAPDAPCSATGPVAIPAGAPVTVRLDGTDLTSPVSATGIQWAFRLSSAPAG
jgi:hypothetical protein